MLLFTISSYAVSYVDHVLIISERPSRSALHANAPNDGHLRALLRRGGESLMRLF